MQNCEPFLESMIAEIINKGIIIPSDKLSPQVKKIFLILRKVRFTSIASDKKKLPPYLALEIK